MLVKLSGDKYINSDHIIGIERRLDSESQWIVYTVGGHPWYLSQLQFDELMDSLPTPASCPKQSKGE